MYPRVVVRACNKNFAQHLLSFPPATNGAKRKLGKLRSPTAENRNKALTLHGYMESSNYSHPLWCPRLSPLGSPVLDYNRCIQLIDRINNTNKLMKTQVFQIINHGTRAQSDKD